MRTDTSQTGCWCRTPAHPMVYKLCRRKQRPPYRALLSRSVRVSLCLAFRSHL